MDCTNCGTQIPAERLEAIPGTSTCTKCSTTLAYVGFMCGTAAKGTAAAVEIINPADKEAMRLALRAHRRSR